MRATALIHETRPAGGFSLMELMITVAIIGILTTIALPSYVSYIARGKRAEAKGALQENAQFLERYYTTRGFYSTAKDSGVAPDLPISKVPSTGTVNYNITAEIDAKTGGYKLTATAVNSMAADGCGNFTLTNTGTQGISGTALSEADCWNR